LRSDSRKLVVGLGNPGEKYSNTRHNIGFKIVLAVHAKFKANDFKTKCNSLYSKKKEWILALPTTFMNRSGIAVKCLIEQFDINLDNIIVVVDDINLPLGEIRLRRSGSDGGHNGLKSIITELGTENFKRLRFGIGQEIEEIRKKYLDTKEFVLSDFEDEEESVLEEKIPPAVELINFFLYENFQKMLDYNSKLNSLSQD